VISGSGFTPGTPTVSVAGVEADTIHVYRDIQTSANLAVNGVNWDFHDHRVINTSNSAGYIFSDAGGPIVCVVRRGHFLRTLTLADGSIVGLSTSTLASANVGTLFIGNSGSDFEFIDSSFTLDFPVGSINLSNSDYESSCVVTAGRLTTSNSDFISGNNAGTSRAVLPTWIFWINGEVQINGGRMYATTPIDNSGIGIWAGTTDSTQGSLYVNVESIQTGNDESGLVGGDSNATIDPLSTVWIIANTLQGNIQGWGAGKLYVIAEKLYGSVNYGVTSGVTSGEIHLILEKLGGYATGSGFYILIGAGVVMFATINDLDFKTNAGFMDASAGAIAYISGMNFTVPSGKDCFFATGSGSVINIVSGIISTGSSNHDCKVTSSGVINVGPGVTFDATKNSIASGGTINLLSFGGLAAFAPTRVASDVLVTNSTTLTAITGLTFNVAAGKTYKFVGAIQYTADATGGAKFAIAGTATATAVIYTVMAGSIAVTGGQQTSLGGAASLTGSTSGVALIEGTITVNAAGTLIVQIAESTAVSLTSATAKQGSTFELKQVA
jgi:hypothetical protein